MSLTLVTLLALQVVSPASAVVKVPTFVLKWDYAAASLAEVQRFTWVAQVGVERVPLPAATCGVPTGQTPPDQWSCTVPIQSAWYGQDVAVMAVPPPPPAPVAPTALRMYPVLAGEK